MLLQLTRFGRSCLLQQRWAHYIFNYSRVCFLLRSPKYLMCMIMCCRLSCSSAACNFGYVGFNAIKYSLVLLLAVAASLSVFLQRFTCSSM